MRLIDAEALKEAIENHFDMLDAYFPNKFIEEIDNAPTVETFTKDNMAGAYNEGYACGSRESERPNESELVKAYTKGFDTGVETVRQKGETSVCQNPKGNCFTCKLFEVCDAKTKPADMRGEDK